MDYLRRVFSVDLRTLALFRASLALVLFYDLGWRAVDLYAHYTDQGLLPCATLLKSPYYRQFWSLYFLDGRPWFTSVLFMANAGALIALLLGYRTRITTLICWVLLISLHNRNPLVLTGGDTILRLLLFWGMFLPLGAVWSMDSFRRQRPHPLYNYFSLGTVALYVQFLMIYVFAWVSKTGFQWWPEGSAVYYALSIEYMTTYLGNLLRHAPGWTLTGLTYGIYWFEALIGVMFFFRTMRVPLIVMLVLMHLGFAATLELGIFPLAGILTAIILIPSSVWEKTTVLGPRSPSADETLVDDFACNAVVKCLIVLCVLCAFLFNLEGTGRFNRFLPAIVKSFIYTLRINQNWAMFSPQPSQTTGWYVIPAAKDDGSKIDLANGGNALSLQKPSNLNGMYGNCRWRKFKNNILRKEFFNYRKDYANFLCRSWNGTHQKNVIKNISVVYFEQRNFDDLIRSNPKGFFLLRNYPCKVER